MNHKSYGNNFAYYYDQLIDESFYNKYIRMINELGTFENILDLACGSGKLSFKLKTNTNNVTGLDNSEEMLMIAHNTNRDLQKGVTFVLDDLTTLTIPRNEYDLITCSLDSINYLSDIKMVKYLFKQVIIGLQEDGYFIFDLLSQHYIDHIVNDYYQCEDLEDFEYVWQVKKIKDNEIKHDLIIASNKGQYQEIHHQYIYDIKVIKECLQEVGFNNINITKEYNELNKQDCSRYYLICRR
ncbi:MAG: class I SAM-dependent DNA methyltransferase [Bacilli bacterium]